MNIKIIFFILFFCFMPSTTQNSCWDALYSTFCCCCQNEQSNTSSSQTNTTTTSPLSSIIQINNLTQNNSFNHPSSTLNGSNLTSPRSSQELASISSNQATNNSPQNSTLSPRQESMSATAQGTYNPAQESPSISPTSLNLMIAYDFNHLVFSINLPDDWDNPENFQVHEQYIRDVQRHLGQIRSSFANNTVHPHQTESTDISS